MSLIVPLSTVRYKDHNLTLYSDGSIKQYFKNTGLTVDLKKSTPSHNDAVMEFQNMVDSNKSSVKATTIDKRKLLTYLTDRCKKIRYEECDLEYLDAKAVSLRGEYFAITEIIDKIHIGEFDKE